MEENTTQSPNPEMQKDNQEPHVISITPQKVGEKKVLTPEEKKAKRKEMMKRLAMIGGITYGVLLVFIIVWALLTAGKDLSIFNYLPLSQNAFSNFLMTLFNILLGLVVFSALLVSLVGLFKSWRTKKEEIEKKKKASKLAMFSGIGFFLLAVLWLLGIWFLGPKLVAEERFGSVIITDPELTIGLTAPVDIVFDATQIPIDDDVYQILSYSWNFGDGDTSTGAIVQHRYTQKGDVDGRYTVVLSVEYMDLKSGAIFDDEFTTEIGIENELVAASFSATPDSGEIPLTVQFDASSSFDADGEIIAYEWDLDGDGRFDDAEGEEVEYEFTQEGSFEVSLRVTDNNGEYNIMTTIIEAGSVGGLRAVITSELKDDESYYIGEKYEWDGSLSQIEDGSISKYEWDFGDGTKVQSRKTSHTFEEAGTFEVTLTVTDADGNKDTDILEITVAEEGTPPSAIIDADPTSGAVPLKVAFDATDSQDPDNDIVEYEWDFDGDGIIDDTGDRVTYTYNETGTFDATLTVIDSFDNQDDTSIEITVGEQGIVADLDVSTTNGEVPLTVQFDASGSTFKEGNIVSYEYDFGDGDTYIGGSSVTYKYSEVGNFKASVTVLGDDGSTDTFSVQIVVRPVALSACFTVNTDSGSAPLFLTVDASCSQGTISSYRWEFGDGDISFDRRPETHIYSKAGTYTVTLEVTSEQGVIDTFENDIVVR